jgi:FtsP/CotA-like multicopper oxidase with cupredoxin domain
MRVSRRGLLLGAGAVLAGGLLPARRAAADDSGKEFRLIAKPSRVNLVGAGYPDTAVWSYNDTVPGPEIRVRQGDRVRVVVENQLPEGTTVHWHGIRVPNAMDGVPGLTQPLIEPGGTFTYEFDLPDAGTYWYHPHHRSFEQVGRGLFGAVVIEEPQPPEVDRDLLWVLNDWRLDEEAAIAGRFGNGMEAAMAGRVGNTVTLNGRVVDEAAVRSGERLRLRLVNAAVARIVSLRFEGHRPLVMALDGQPVEPHVPEGERILLGPAMRADLLIDMTGKPGQRFRVVDDFYERLAYRLVDLVYAERAPVRNEPPAAPKPLAANAMPEPDLRNAERHDVVLSGGMMSGMMGQGGGMMGGGMMGGMMHGGSTWAINGVAAPPDSHAMPPMLTVARGRTCALTFRNESVWWHPMHLHGHAFRVLSRNGAPTKYREWRDTVLVAPSETVEVAFGADNPGDWMLHCHVLDHQQGGMMTVIRVA